MGLKKSCYRPSWAKREEFLTLGVRSNLIPRIPNQKLAAEISLGGYATSGTHVRSPPAVVFLLYIRVDRYVALSTSTCYNEQNERVT